MRVARHGDRDLHLPQLELIRLDEELVLKTSGPKGLVGSSPTGSAKPHFMEKPGAKEWILSPEGKKAMKKFLLELEESEEELREARRIRPEDLLRVWGR